MLSRFSFAVPAMTLLMASSVPCAAELPPPVAAKLLVMVSKGIGQGGRVAAKDPSIAGELKNLGSLDGNARVAWAVNEAEVKAEVARNRCVICNNPKLLSFGAVLALVEEGGKPKFIISRESMNIFGITLPDAVTRIATFQ